MWQEEVRTYVVLRMPDWLALNDAHSTNEESDAKIKANVSCTTHKESELCMQGDAYIQLKPEVKNESEC